MPFRLETRFENHVTRLHSSAYKALREIPGNDDDDCDDNNCNEIFLGVENVNWNRFSLSASTDFFPTLRPRYYHPEYERQSIRLSSRLFSSEQR